MRTTDQYYHSHTTGERTIHSTTSTQHTHIAYIRGGQQVDCDRPVDRRVSVSRSQWHTQKIFMRVFIQWQMVVICIWCALFVTSQFDVIFMFSSDVC